MPRLRQGNDGERANDVARDEDTFVRGFGGAIHLFRRMNIRIGTSQPLVA